MKGTAQHRDSQSACRLTYQENKCKHDIPIRFCFAFILMIVMKLLLFSIRTTQVFPLSSLKLVSTKLNNRTIKFWKRNDRWFENNLTNQSAGCICVQHH